MSQQTYFESYMEIIQEGLKSIRKISFKKINTVNELLTKFEGFASKQVYGRIKPTNYLLMFLIALGARNTKLYAPMILTIQKLFSYNYISADEKLNEAMQFVKEEHKEFLILPYADYARKSFQEVYIETLVALPDRTEIINLLVSKNMSLIFRLSQSTLPKGLIGTACDFLVDAILVNKSDEYDKVLKSTFLEIVRHAVESLKEASDRKLLESDEQISIKQVCERYGAVLADEVAIRLNVQQRHKIDNYPIIPLRNEQGDLSQFQVRQFEEANQRNYKNGKFGWCIVCRKPANYYCRAERVPVCGFECKQLNLFQTQQLEKFYFEQFKFIAVFTTHVEEFCRLFCKYLSHSDIRRRTAFAETFIHLSSELRKINIKTASPAILGCLQDIFEQCCSNIILETQAFVACTVAVKKLIPLDIFVPQTQILIHELAKKLTHYITPIQIKQETLKLIRDLIKSEALFEMFMNIDCHPERKDVVHEIVSSISKLYIGITPPEGISTLPPEDPNTRKLCFDILSLLEKNIRGLSQNKILGENQSLKLELLKKQKNILKSAIKRFNKAEKPTKVVKKLISQKFLSKNPKQIAEFLHSHLKRLSFVNIGQLIGDHDPLGISIRDEFIHQMQFKDHLVDEGLRILLTHFTIPGESQIVDRIIQSFSKEYFSQNDGQQVFKNTDAVFSFSYLLMMLQTNLHNPQVIEKMTFEQFRKLSHNMNGPGSQFPLDFLQKIYASIQKKQLGFHSKKHQIETINAYQKNEIKRAQQIHLKYLQGHLAKQYRQLIPDDPSLPRYEKLHVKLLILQLFGAILNALSLKIRETQEKQQLTKSMELVEEMIRHSLSFGIEDFVCLAIKNIWEEITKTHSTKRYILTQRLYSWAREFSAQVYEEWVTIIRSFSMFHRTKAIRKDNANKSSIMVVVQDKCYLYDNYVEGLLAKSNKFNHRNLECLIDALVEVSKEEIADSQLTFCLEKLGDVFEFNNSRLPEIVPMTWGKLKEYYIELGKHKIQNVALFGTDFLKQLVTKFIKKKDLQFYQKQYLRPFQEVFTANVPLGVKEYIVGGLSYFVNNYFPNIKDGWKIILSILCESFDEDEDQVVKQKSHMIVKKIYETNFSMIDLDENYVDFVQILGRMAREKDETYIKSCLEAIKTIITFYESKLQINMEDPNAAQNEKLDMIFWQTMWLPLLSTIYGICGDFRPQVQNQSIQLLFHILMRYGKLFKYEFWKMIMQGILRPTFEEITYTSQSKPLRKKELEEWLKNSFSRLFASINKLILEYFDDFKLFLPDILKIYESCIVSNSNKILTQLSTEALTELLRSAGDQFENMNWKEYIEFIKTVFKKSWPTEIESLENWKKVQEVPEQSTYQGKVLTLNLVLLNCQYAVERFSNKLQQSDLIDIREVINQVYTDCHKFNKNIQLRESLWKNGFFEELKSLPGLIRQEHEAVKGISLVKFKLIDKSEMYIDQYAQHALKLLEGYKKALILSPPKSYSAELEQKERESTMLQIQILENVMPHLESIGLGKLVELGYKRPLFKYMLNACAHRSYCSKCTFCQFCLSNGDRENKFTEVMKEWVKRLFEFEAETETEGQPE